jgi:hypothetical protein
VEIAGGLGSRKNVGIILIANPRFQRRQRHHPSADACQMMRVMKEKVRQGCEGRWYQRNTLSRWYEEVWRGMTSVTSFSWLLDTFRMQAMKF